MVLVGLLRLFILITINNLPDGQRDSLSELARLSVPGLGGTIEHGKGTQKA